MHVVNVCDDVSLTIRLRSSVAAVGRNLTTVHINIKVARILIPKLDSSKSTSLSIDSGIKIYTRMHQQPHLCEIVPSPHYVVPFPTH